MAFPLLYLSLHVIICFTMFITLVNGDCDSNYGVMIDAGSTGSRLYVYQWSQRVVKMAQEQEQIAELPISFPVQEIGNLKTNVGVGSLEPAQAVQSLEALVDSAVSFVQSKCDSAVSSTPIFLKGTAGMRLLESERREALLFALREYFSSTEFLFQDSFCSVISGEQEALFAWYSVNYLLHTLYNAWETSPSVSTYGVLDLGGASTQIAFQTPDTILQNGYSVQLGLHQFDLYTYSFLHFGENEMFALTTNSLLRGSYSSDSVVHPCMFQGWETMSNDTYFNPALPVLIKGSSDAQKCMDVFLEFVGHSQQCWTPPCSFNGVYQPSLPSMTFYAISGYFTSISEIGMNPESSLEVLRDKITEVCAMNWTQVVEIYGESQFSPMHCYGLAYSYSLLKHGYGFSDEQKLVFANSIQGTTLSWTLGAMLFEANLSPFTLVREPIQIEATVHHSKSGIFMIILVAVCVSISAYMVSTRQSRNNPFHRSKLRTSSSSIGYSRV